MISAHCAKRRLSAKLADQTMLSAFPLYIDIVLICGWINKNNYIFLFSSAFERRPNLVHILRHK